MREESTNGDLTRELAGGKRSAVAYLDDRENWCKRKRKLRLLGLLQLEEREGVGSKPTHRH
jgi:hypothetical protein